ncbi:glycosyltransferase family 4 protein [Frisingicoccus sp.]|uniref:glycosyltransferase family 4 protein n=1 Tax=Frisingicoccus sp. TaxID=1918627 RepID=UPI003999A721
MKKVLLVTFSDNADHQDITFGMFESIYTANRDDCDIWTMGINTPKVSVMATPHTHLVDCPKRPGIEKKTFDIKELHRIIKWIKSEQFDVIFFETLHVWNLAIMLCCHKKTVIFQMIHDVIPHQGDKQAKSVDLMNKAVCKLADFIVLCNQKYIMKVTEIYGVPQNRVRFVDMWRRFPKYTEPSYSKRALFFGRMNPYKGVDNLLEIARECPEIQFDVVGRVEPQVQEQVDELKTLPNVTMNNEYVTDAEMAEAFIKADWIVLPYSSATQSGVVIDGYRYGRPSIAFSVGAITEQINDGVSGFLIPEADKVAFVERLKATTDMGIDEYKKMSIAAYEYGVRKYSAEGAIERFVQVIS